MPNPKAPDFHTIYANGIGYAIGDQDARIAFGLSDPENPTTVTEHVAVYMTPKTLKMLAQATSELVLFYEKIKGGEIAVEPERIEKLKEILSSALTHPSVPLQPSSQSQSAVPKS